MSRFIHIETLLENVISEVKYLQNLKSIYQTSTDLRDLEIISDHTEKMLKFLCRHDDLPDFTHTIFEK